MPKSFAIQLPVADLEKSGAFYAALGFQPMPMPGPHADKMLYVALAENIGLLLLTRDFFATFTPNPVADARAGTQVINAMGMESREAVDALTKKAVAAGGAEIGEAREMDNAVYFRFFADPDGHQWEVNFMFGQPDDSGEKS